MNYLTSCVTKAAAYLDKRKGKSKKEKLIDLSFALISTNSQIKSIMEEIKMAKL